MHGVGMPPQTNSKEGIFDKLEENLTSLPCVVMFICKGDNRYKCHVYNVSANASSHRPSEYDRPVGTGTGAE